MSNPEIAREIDPKWFLPQSNMNEYTRGYFAGRDYERKRILAILNDWPLNVQLDWEDIFGLINEGMEYRQLTMSPALLEDYKVRAAQIERERLFDAVRAFFDRTAPAHDSDHNPWCLMSQYFDGRCTCKNVRHFFVWLKETIKGENK